MSLKQFLQRPAIAHLVRAVQRFGERNGPLYAAAITYFSVLSIVPILMFTFAMLGMTVTVLRPEWMSSVKEAIISRLSEGEFADGLATMIDNVFTGWASVGVIALVLALWTGSGWIGNLRKAVQAQILDEPAEKRNPILEILINIGTFLLLLVLTLATLAISTLSTTFNENVLAWFGLSDRVGAGALVSLIAVVITTLAGALLFCYLFLVLPGQRIPRKILLLGSLGGGIGLTLLQSLAGLVTGMFRNNVSAQLFGPVIILMLFFNLYATLIMLVAAWMGTAEASVVEPEMVEPQAQPSFVLGPSPARSQKSFADGQYEPVEPDPNVLVPQDVAAKGVRIGAAVGYGLGAATGIGLGAFIASLVKGWFRRPKA